MSSAGDADRRIMVAYSGDQRCVANGAWIGDQRGGSLSIERSVSGFHARVVQHELDHLDGVLYPQRMTDLASLIFTSEAGARYDEAEALRRFPAASGPATEGRSAAPKEGTV